MRDTFNRMIGRTRYVVFRLFLHLGRGEVAPILRILNRAGQNAIDADGDLEVLGEGLVEICETLLRYQEYWLSAANEGDVFWDEGEAGDYVNNLFTDCAQRYLGESDYSSVSGFNEPLSVPANHNLIVIIVIAYEGEVPELETDLSNVQALKEGLKVLINLHYRHQLRAIAVHFSPAQLGDELTNDRLLQYYPELVPLETTESESTVSKPSPQAINEAIEVFLSYAREDEALLEELVKHLSILQRQKVIKTWYDRQISAGAETNAEIDEHFNTARIILLLISADFLRSDDCYSTVERAMKRHKAGEAHVIPVILRPVDYQGAVFNNLQPLPVHGKPVIQWTNHDAAFSNVATGIRKVVEELASKNL